MEVNCEWRRIGDAASYKNIVASLVIFVEVGRIELPSKEKQYV